MSNETNAAESAGSTPTMASKRSPNYPVFSLPKALAKAELLHGKARTTAVPIPIACDYMGVKSTSSSGMRCVSALQEYGLAITEGRGKAKTIKITEAGRLLLKLPDRTSSDYRAALQEAALGPKIHQKIWDRWGAEMPPEEALKYELESPDWGFTEAAAEALVSEFRETVEFARLTEGDTGGHDDAEDGDPPQPPPPAPATGAVTVGGAVSAESKHQPLMPPATASSKTIPIQLQSGGVVSIHLPYPLDEQDFAWMRTLVDGLKPAMLSKHALRLGDYVQWTSQGADQFPEPKRLIRIEGGFAFVEGSETGIPAHEVYRA